MKRMGFPAREGRSISFSGVFLDVHFSLVPEHLLIRLPSSSLFPWLLTPPRPMGLWKPVVRRRTWTWNPQGFPLHPSRPELLGL